MADVFIVGPVMIAGALMSDPPPNVRRSLLVFGIGTILYNLQNYLAERDS